MFDPTRLDGNGRPRLLDLYCGAGGTTKGYQRAGFYVVGLDIKWQPNYCGDLFIKADAIDWLSENIEFVAENFVAVHASPPCQAFSRVTRERYNHPKVIDQLRERLQETGLEYIIENVEGYYAGLINPIKLCGSSFGLRVQRHRLFETSFWIEEPPQCEHEWQDEDSRFLVQEHGKWEWRGVLPVYGEGGGKGREYWPSAMGCGTTWDDCWMTPYELTQAIPPAYTEYVGSKIPVIANA